MKGPAKAITAILAIVVVSVPILYEGQGAANNQPSEKTTEYPASLQTVMQLPSSQTTTPSWEQALERYMEEEINGAGYRELIEKSEIAEDLFSFLHKTTGDEYHRQQAEFFARIINMANNASELNEEELVALEVFRHSIEHIDAEDLRRDAAFFKAVALQEQQAKKE